jgi:xylan 1,4-beta-xylosidase
MSEDQTTVQPATPGTLSPAWRRCVGTGRANLALRSEFRDALALARAEAGFEYVRGHGLLSDDMGLLRESEGVRRESYRYIDLAIDTYLDLGVRPVLELGFMPELLASGSQTVFWWKGHVTPPREWADWAGLVGRLVRHLVDRYGVAEVARWPIEVWNEPNHPYFWEGADQAAYLTLYAAAARAVKEVDATLQVGGPAVQPGGDPAGWIAAFAEFCERESVPADFVSAHAYSSGPPETIPFGVYQTLREPDDLLRQFAMPRGVLAGTALADRPVWITEFNSSYDPRNPIHDTAYNACYLAPVLVHGGEHCDAFSYWTVCDVFEEQGPPTSVFHGGFGLLADRGLRKPTFHLYAFMARLGETVLAGGPDHVVTRRADGSVAILAWQPVGGSADGPYGSAPATHRVTVDIPVAAPAAFVRRQVNEADGNAWTAWRDLGRPPAPTPRQMGLLLDAAEPRVSHGELEVAAGSARLDLTLQRHEVTLVEVLPVTPHVHEGFDDTRLLG